MKRKQTYEEGQRVVFIPEKRVYDFGYYSATPGRCIIYKEGERNMQDSYVVALTSIQPAEETE